MLTRLLELFESIPAPFVIAAALLLPAVETAFLLGLLVPGELVVLAAGVRAAGKDVPLWMVMAAGSLGAVAGDSIGYFVGRRLRTTIEHRLKAKRRRRAEKWLKNQGLPAVFLARFTPFLRSVMPPAAGASKIRYHEFLLWDVPAGVLWGTGSALLGYYAGHQSAAVLDWAAGIGLLLFVAYLLVSRSRRKKHRTRRRAEAASSSRGKR